jgi:apolipoprotein N-acyltransferase
VFLRRGKSTDGWALVGFGIFACIFSWIGLSGGSGAVESVSRLGLMIHFGIPLGITAIIGGIVVLYRDGRRPQD